MTALLDGAPYEERDDEQFLQEAVSLTHKHLKGCSDYFRIWGGFCGASAIDELPYMHVGLFKRITFRTEGVASHRVLLSSATSSGVSSQVVLDDFSSKLQAKSSLAILKDFVGDRRRPLVIVDDPLGLRQRGKMSARMAAALSLLPLATTTTFLLKGDSPQWDLLEEAISLDSELLVYGFTWALWRHWIQSDLPHSLRTALVNKQVNFVHSGGWKKLETIAVSRDVFDTALLSCAAAGSRVVDFYGLVEQNGIIFPLCEAGARHVPRWAAVIVRDPWTLSPLKSDEIGLLQFINLLAHGSPYHSVITEDVGSILPGSCACGRGGQRFTLLGRVPKSELRGCANVGP
jgi:hypothetical protein